LKRLVIGACMALALADVAPAAEEHAKSGEASGGSSVTWWKLANFVLLAGGLGYLIHKKGRAFFGVRTREIRQAIEDAARLKAEAESRAAEVEQRLANLAAEVEALRRNARQETAAEAERAGARLRQEITKVQAEAEQEIASAARAARRELQGYAADLAVRLAEQQLRGRMSPDVQERLVGTAIQELGRAGSPATEAGRPA
jgi:F-type H+-transporting ATPase subunit b